MYYLPATVGPRLLWARRRARRRRSHHPAQDALRRIRCSSPTGAHPACRCKSSGLRPRKWGKEREGGRGGLIWGPASRRAGSGCRIASARGRRPPTTAPRWRRRAGSRRSSAPRACSPWRPEQAAPPQGEVGGLGLLQAVSNALGAGIIKFVNGLDRAVYKNWPPKLTWKRWAAREEMG